MKKIIYKGFLLALTSTTLTTHLQSMSFVAGFLNRRGMNEQLQEALAQAAETGDENIVNALKQAGANVDCELVKEAYKGNVIAIETLLRTGADINYAYQAGWFRVNRTALMAASASGHLAVVRVLLAAGADVDKQTDDTALSLAVRSGYIDIAQLLLGVGADVNVRAYNGTALWQAQQKTNRPMIEMLVVAGASNSEGPRWTAGALP